MKKNNYQKDEILIICFILIISSIFTVSIGVYGFGDSPSYYSMTNSLVKDGDLIIDNRDVARWNSCKFHNVPAGTYILIDEKGTMRYAKPILYPLIAAPFFFLFGNIGFAMLNGLFLGSSIALGYIFLKKYFNKNNSLLISALFFLCSFMPVYATWIHPEMMLFFACSLCLWLWRYKNQTISAAFIIGIVSSVKIIFLLLLVPLIVILTLEKRFRELFKTIAICLLGISIMLFLTLLFIRQFSPYNGLRGYISPSRIPYFTLKDVRDALVITPSVFKGMEFNSWGLFFRNILNFFMGRFTGIIWYAFPGVVCVAIYLLNRQRINKKEKVFGDVILLVIFLLLVMLIIIKPLNYFGGRGVVGNRYFFILPALLFLPTIKAFKKPAKIALIFLPGLFLNFQIIKNEIFIKNYAAHTSVFPLRYAFLEISQIEALPVRQIGISEDIFLYTPLGLEEQVGKKILINSKQEVVIVQKNRTNYLKLETDRGEIILQPKEILKNKVSREVKSFYYFKAGRLTWVNNIY